MLWAATAGAMGCAGEPEERCTTIGRPGGLMHSNDNVITIAIQPEALDEDVDFCIVESDRPPEVYGSAYRVFPNPSLHFAAAISYRFALPDDIDEVNIGRVDADAFAQGMGEWQSLPGCRTEADVRQVTCSDDTIAKFYGLLDDFEGLVSDSFADGSETGTGAGPGSDPTNAVTTQSMTTTPVTDTNETNDTTDTEDPPPPPPIEYPPECDDIPPGPFEVIEVGQIFEAFEPFALPFPAGPEDLAADGQGGFVGRRRETLVRLDITGATYGVPMDPGFVVQDLVAPTFPTTASLGLRYRSTGELVMMQNHRRTVEIVNAAGDDFVEVLDLMLPNGLFVDTDDILWMTTFNEGEIIRYDVERDDDSVVANVPAPNGVIYDPLRGMVFFVNLDGGVARLQRQQVSPAGAPIGDTEEVVGLVGNPDGITLDVCGNLYVVDREDSRIDRVFMNDAGEEQDVEEIVEDVGADVSNAVFAYGEPYGDFQTCMFIGGLDGDVFYMDVGLHGAPVPVLAAPPLVNPG